MIIEEKYRMFHNDKLFYTITGTDANEDLDWYPEFSDIPYSYLKDGYLFYLGEYNDSFYPENNGYIYLNSKFHKTNYIDEDKFFQLKRNKKIADIFQTTLF